MSPEPPTAPEAGTASQAEPAADRANLAALADEHLIGAIARAGDRRAFAELFRRYAGRIKGFLIRGGASDSAAEDAAQEVMVTLWRRAALFDPDKAAAATWIFAIARNRRIDMVRREARGRPDPLDPAFHPEPEPEAGQAMAGAERDGRVRAAIATLGPEQREVVALAFFSDISHSEIASRLDLPLGTVKSRLRLAFGRLRTELGVDFSLELRDD